MWLAENSQQDSEKADLKFVQSEHDGHDEENESSLMTADALSERKGGK